MAPRGAKPYRWTLQAALLAPVTVLFVALVVISGFGITSSLEAQRQTVMMLRNRAETALTTVLDRIEERRQAGRAITRLLATEDEVPAALARRDRQALARFLGNHARGLWARRVDVFLADGQPFLGTHPMTQEVEDLAAPLVAAALAGEEQSLTTIDPEGVLVLTVAPIHGPGGIIGAISVCSAITRGQLATIRDREGIDLAIGRGRAPIASTLPPAELTRLFPTSQAATGDTPALTDHLAAQGFLVLARPMGVDGWLIALTPTSEIERDLQQRSLIMLAGAGLVVALLLAAGLVLARSIGRPLRAMLATTGEMARGNYRQRVEPSAIAELNDLAITVNNLAEQLERQMAQLSHQAFYDSLTGLPNRALFLDRLGQALARAKRHGTRVAVLFVGLDNIKVVNDSLGHQAGDRLLIAMAERLQGCLNADDTVARFEGDEFTIVLDSLSHEQAAPRMAERLAERLRSPLVLAGQEIFATASIGIALSLPGEEQPEALLHDADLAMERAKQEGKNRAVLFDRSITSPALTRLGLEADLRRALERDELRLHYQPIVDLETGQITEVEALIRWEHPERGLVSPAQFIPLAEETGLILPIGLWVLREACRQARAWQLLYATEAPLVMAVNLSARQFQNPALGSSIVAILVETSLDSSCLKLEITESTMMRDAHAASETLWALKALGVQLAIDDFGTGYSSLAYLKNLPIDILKIDRAFVEGLATSSEDQAIVRSIIALAKTLNLRVIGEGIETTDQVARLRQLECDQGQGYFFARPLPADKIGPLLAGGLASTMPPPTHAEPATSTGAAA